MPLSLILENHYIIVLLPFLLLVMVIIGLNLFAIGIRNNLREKFRALEGL